MVVIQRRSGRVKKGEPRLWEPVAAPVSDKVCIVKIALPLREKLVNNKVPLHHALVKVRVNAVVVFKPETVEEIRKQDVRLQLCCAGGVQRVVGKDHRRCIRSR